jgi:hypothetical protein
MKKPQFGFVLLFFGLLFFVSLFISPIVLAAEDRNIPEGGLGHEPSAGWLQQPTVSIPTVTGTPSGPIAVVYSEPEEQINVREGPGTEYPKVGVLLNRQQVPALGASPGGLWVQIIYQGVPGSVAWVYAPLVRIQGGELPVVELPPTPTPRVTPTIDPTLAAQFVVNIPPTRLPTFTPPPPLVIPTFSVEQQTRGTGNVPMGFVIIGLGVIGSFGLVISLLRRG